jgi:hypothetical protein
MAQVKLVDSDLLQLAFNLRDAVCREPFVCHSMEFHFSVDRQRDRLQVMRGRLWNLIRSSGLDRSGKRAGVRSLPVIRIDKVDVDR